MYSLTNYLYILSLKEPVQICLGTHQASARSSCELKEVKDTFVYIPLLQVIESLLKCPAVYEEVYIVYSLCTCFIIIANKVYAGYI